MDAHAVHARTSTPTRAPGVYVKIGAHPVRAHRARGRALRDHLRGACRRHRRTRCSRSSCRCCSLLSAVKFALVAMFYMHLKQDHRLFSGVFVFPLIIATVIILALIALDGVPLRLRDRADDPAALRARSSTSGRGRPDPVRAELVAPSQRTRGHRASRCLVLLRDRTAPPPGTGLGPPAPRWQVACFGACAARPAGVAQRADPRPERLLPLLGPHGAAPGAHARCFRRSSSLGLPGWLLSAAPASDRGASGGARADPAGRGRRHLLRHDRRVARRRRTTTS